VTWLWRVLVIFIVVNVIGSMPMIAALHALHLMQQAILLSQTTPKRDGPEKKQGGCNESGHKSRSITGCQGVVNVVRRPKP
jgi:hypothetical protein